ncbi:MAG: hypothetical protein HOW73_49240 [Polyangiaceae bacterium]|nr:hypothetical protein [Polyangiaceae bacterium]
MIETVVQYLHNAGVPFRLFSYPNSDARAGHPLRQGAMLVDLHLASVNEEPVLLCVPAGEQPDFGALGALLGGTALPSSTDVLPGEFRGAAGPIPPLGLFGIPIVVDERIAACSTIVFGIFGDHDIIEMSYDDFARMERPRSASFASMGELPSAQPRPVAASAR